MRRSVKFVLKMEIRLLSCPLCLKPHFEGVDSLRATLVSVATSTLTCPVCNESLQGLDKLTIHLFSHINAPVKEIAVHENVQQEIDKSIDILSSSKQQTEDALKEEFAVNDQPSKILTCDICNFSFTDKNILEMHQKLLHQTTPDKKTGLYSYHCHLCSKKFKMRGSLMVHLRVAHYGFSHSTDSSTKTCENEAKDSDDVFEERVNDNENREAKVTAKGQCKGQDNKQWGCDVCSKMFTTKYFLKKHKRLHTGEMPYCCTLCNKSFTFQQSYHKHMLYHSSEKPYVCNECGRAFKELSTLQNHARIHSGERPFGCETCGKRFRQRVSYLVHRRIHTGVMPYKCTACDKSFRYKVSQRSHKCPMNPPGSVIRVPDPEKNSQESISLSNANVKCIMSVDYNTGNINFIPENQNGFLNNANIKEEDNSIRNNGLSRCQNKGIEISYSKNDVQSSTINQLDLRECLRISNEGTPKYSSEQEQSDLFSMVLSPMLPEVESLCLNNNSPVNNSPVSPNLEENVNIIREKCLDEILFSTNN